MLEIGNIVLCMVSEFTNGKMADNMKVNINLIKDMEWVFLCGQMVSDMKENGSKGNKKALVELLCLIKKYFIRFIKMVKS